MSDNSESGTTTESRPETRLELFIQQAEGGLVAATVPVRWCVNPELIEAIKARDFVNPQLVIAVRALQQEMFLDKLAANPNQTSVHIVPLTQELEFVSFRRPGANEIRVVIVDADDDNAFKTLREIARGRGGSGKTVFDDNGTPSWVTIKRPLKYIQVDVFLHVEVPADMFAPPPPKWQSKLVKRFYPDQEVDQCHMRRRTIASVVGLVLMLTVGQVVKVLALVGELFLGFRKIPWGSLLHPYEDGEQTAYMDANKHSFWFQDKKGNARPSPLWLVNPIILTAIPSLVFFLMQIAANNNDGKKHALAYKLSFPGWWNTVWMTDLAIVCLAVAITIGFFAVVGIGALASMYTGSETRRQRLRRQKEEEEEIRKTTVVAALEAMTCSSTSSNVSLNALPSGKKTVHLRYRNLKAQVCKPFAR